MTCKQKIPLEPVISDNSRGTQARGSGTDLADRVQPVENDLAGDGAETVFGTCEFVAPVVEFLGNFGLLSVDGLAVRLGLLFFATQTT